MRVISRPRQGARPRSCSGDAPSSHCRRSRLGTRFRNHRLGKCCYLDQTPPSAANRRKNTWKGETGCVSYSLEHADCDWRPDACAAAAWLCTVSRRDADCDWRPDACAAALVLASCARLRPDAARTRVRSPSYIVGCCAELEKKEG